jgi:hypothetical protein
LRVVGEEHRAGLRDEGVDQPSVFEHGSSVAARIATEGDEIVVEEIDGKLYEVVRDGRRVPLFD